MAKQTKKSTEPTPSYVVSNILQGSAYALSIFSAKEIKTLDLFEKKGKPYLTCSVTDKPRQAKPEEIVRQLYLRKLMDHYGYPKQHLAIETKVRFGTTVHPKRADIVVYETEDTSTPAARPLIIVEVKKPKRQDGVEQLKSYCSATDVPVAVWTNGSETKFLHRDRTKTQTYVYRDLPDLPRFGQTLDEMLNEPWTLKELNEQNILVAERTSLKDIILDMENLVLANAGVDAFEEVFKLIYAKLFDEHRAARTKSKKLDFRVGLKTPAQFAEVVHALFDKATNEWKGVFAPGERIDLLPDHLLTCGSALERVKLFNSNLSVIDEAFEYLTVKASKGEKGQYFTPRHVIDMCVKMLSPTVEEYVGDTAAGSCGFSVHALFHVWGNEFTAEGPNPWQTNYAATHVYGIDFDPRSVKIAKALNTIAGDGKTNVYRANSLDPSIWTDDTKAGLKPRLREMPTPAEKRENEKAFRYFDFDVMLTNPPFAGDIKDARILGQYELAKNPEETVTLKNGTTKTKGGDLKNRVGRDILFIERNLQFLRPGGRAARVLPQGRFNNSGDESLRRWIADRARILAVVGLHNNTFKPHTGTKTSVLFLQTWNDADAPGSLYYNPKPAGSSEDFDYPVFLATSERPGKDNSGDYIYRIGEANAPALDEHHHMIVEHDLEEIAEAFKTWGLKQGMAFCREAE